MARSIMIIGNGEIETGLESVINAADVVMRFNDCRSVGPGGTRTDIVAVCNTGRPAKRMLADAGWKNNPSVRSASSIWCVRDPQEFAAMRAPLAISHPALDDFCDDHTDGFRAFCEESGKMLHVIPAETHARLDRQLAAYDPEPYVVPSTGLVAISEVLGAFSAPGDRVCLAGFGHQGWEWHPWEAERRWVEWLIKQGKLEKCGISCYV
jgi:hypothetical protein